MARASWNTIGVDEPATVASRVEFAFWDALLPMAAGFVALGCIVRAWFYFQNFSLNHDDSALALNIMERSVWQLGAALDHGQLAPWGFLATERAVIWLAGTSEPALRLVPFLASLASVPAFWYLARRQLPRPEAVIAAGFFSVSQALVGSTVQVKQYSGEVLLSILLFIACRPLLDRSMTRRERLIAAATGAVAIWFSFPAVFILAGIGVVSIVVWRSAETMRGCWIVVTAWIVSGMIYAGGILRFQLRGSHMFTFWESEFLPTDPTLWGPWLVRALQNIGAVSTSVRLAPVAAVALVVALWLTCRSRRRFSVALALAILATLLASAARLYPFVGRFLFFAAPVLLLLAFEEIGYWVRARSAATRRTFTVVVSLALAYATASLLKNSFLTDPAFDDPRGVFAAVHQRSHAGDLIYLSKAAWPSFKYYQPRIGISGDSVIPASPTTFQNEHPASLPHQAERVWFVFFWPTEGGMDTSTVLHFDRSGTVLDSVTRKQHAAVLWELKPASSTAGESP